MQDEKPPRLRLATMVSIGVCGTVLVTMLSLLLLVEHFAKSYAIEQAEQRLQQLSWQMRDALNHSMQRVVENLHFIAQLDAVRDGRPAEMRRVFDQVAAHSGDYTWVGFADPDGKVVAASHGMLQGDDVSQRPWYVNGRKDLYASDYHASAMLEPLLPYSEQRWRFVDVALPVKGPDGRLRGVLAIHLSWDWARGKAGALLIPSNNQYMTEVLVVRDDDTIILGPDYVEETKVDVSSVDLAQSGRTGAVVEDWPDGHRYITGYARTGLNLNYPGPKWSILVRQPEEIALASFDDLERRILLAGGVICILLALITVVLARRLAYPLDNLSAAIRRGEDGLLQAIPVSGEYREVQLLSMTLAEMVEREREHVGNLHALNENLEQLVRERTQEIAHKARALEDALAQQMAIQARLKDSEAELRATLQNANDAFIAMDHDGFIVEWNEQAERQFGWTHREAVGRRMAELIVPHAMREAYEKGIARFRRTGEARLMNRRLEMTALRRDGVEFPIELSIACVPRQAGPLFIAFLHDITERKLLQASLTGMAMHDALTDLPNRRALMQKLPEAMARATRSRRPLAVLFLDLDGFKEVNDGYGHEAGDELLRVVAQRMQGAVRSTDTVARLAGDEFVLLLELLNDEEDALEVAAKILAGIQQPFVLSAATVTLTASVGVAMYWPGEEATVDQLITRADGAMYAAKRKGKNRAVAV